MYDAKKDPSAEITKVMKAAPVAKAPAKAAAKAARKLRESCVDNSQSTPCALVKTVRIKGTRPSSRNEPIEMTVLSELQNRILFAVQFDQDRITKTDSV